jgi:hypothetical protein
VYWGWTSCTVVSKSHLLSFDCDTDPDPDPGGWHWQLVASVAQQQEAITQNHGGHCPCNWWAVPTLRFCVAQQQEATQSDCNLI